MIKLDYYLHVNVWRTV